MIEVGLIGSRTASLYGNRIQIRPNKSLQSSHRFASLVKVRASDDNQQPADKPTEGASNDPAPKSQRRRRRRQSKKEATDATFNLVDLNPITMGRKSREVFDDVWTQLQRIGSPTRSVSSFEEIAYELTVPSEFESPQAADTTVLVTGATGRVGKVLVRKLLLRNYKVKALVRQRTSDADEEAIPQSVELVYGDVGDYKACRQAVKGVDKIICCSAARTNVTADLTRVEEEGVANLSRALQDEKNAAARKNQNQVSRTSKIDVADFADERYHPDWDIMHVGPADDENDLRKSLYSQTRAAQRRRAAKDSAEAYIDDKDNLVFEGSVYSRGGYAEVGADVTRLPHGDALSGSEGFIMRIKGDAHAYSLVAETTTGATYNVKFTTNTLWSTVRLPYNIFLPTSPGIPSLLDPANIAKVKLRFEPKPKMLEAVTEAGASPFDGADNRFKLEIDWIKALPGGDETDFILVSCAGSAPPEVEQKTWDKVISAKRLGEGNLRNSGLGYTIIRPGPLAEEAGGYKALVFDQGNRISQNIACADVADVCLKALHDPLARNKTFEVCWEYTPEEGLETYELVAHLPDKANNYLSPALATLSKNT